MARYRIDDVGVSWVRRSLAADPATFRSCATSLSVTVSSAKGAVDTDSDGLLRALERLRVVHVGTLHAVADAAAALGGDLVVDSERETQLGSQWPSRPSSASRSPGEPPVVALRDGRGRKRGPADASG